MFADTYLWEAVFDWFEPYIRDFNENLLENQKAKTKEIFESYKEFKKRLEATFEDPDKKQTAERKLYSLQ